MANYGNQENTVDYFIDEKNLDLITCSCNETMLFSGIPEPEAKPIPDKPNHEKATTITVKNKKSLKKTFLNF